MYKHEHAAKTDQKERQHHPKSDKNEVRKSIAQLNAKNMPCAVGGATPQTPRNTTVQQNS